MGGKDETRVLLQDWCNGNREALHVLLERNLDWLRGHVERRLGQRLRRKAQTTDFVQAAAMEVLEYGPRFLCQSERQFRALLGRIVENSLRDEADWFRARRRDIERERPLPSDSVLDLGPRRRAERPSQIAQRNEAEAWTRLAVKLLDPEDQQLIYLREWDKLPFGEIGERLGITVDAARMRFNRAVSRLADKIVQLQTGQIPGGQEDAGI